ncbi:unnamed protein product, partial [Angiostrongylus costaricensis]|uniref:Mitochondrial inner membrane protein Mpv17 n=1 Tax=Angiostrongylus costaricensis TaxID=334426 RepID=A0A0R3PZN9_ANGCS
KRLSTTQLFCYKIFKKCHIRIFVLFVSVKQILERVKGSQKIVPLKRLAIDQVCFFAPPFHATILIVLRMLEGVGVNESCERMRNDWWTIYANNLKIWPAVQLINFYLIPLNMRVIIVQVVAFFWNTYLSYRTQAEKFYKRRLSQ